MAVRWCNVRWRQGALIGLAVYALVLLGSPVLHHDLECHLKSPTHCTACTASPIASRIEHGAALDRNPLRLAGDVLVPGPSSLSGSTPLETPGRAPPA